WRTHRGDDGDGVEGGALRAGPRGGHKSHGGPTGVEKARDVARREHCATVDQAELIAERIVGKCSELGDLQTSPRHRPMSGGAPKAGHLRRPRASAPGATRRNWSLLREGVVCSRRAPSWIACPRRGAACGGSIMKFSRRTFLHLAVSAAALPAVPRISRAQVYPSRPVRIVVGFPAGGATDIQARLMGQWLSDRLGQQFIIENRAGASGNIGTEAVAKAPADGYTLLQVVTPHAINAALYTNLNFDFIRDITPVICAARLAYVVVVHPSVPTTTIPEFIAYAKANPGKIN